MSNLNISNLLCYLKHVKEFSFLISINIIISGKVNT